MRIRYILCFGRIQAPPQQDDSHRFLPIGGVPCHKIHDRLIIRCGGILRHLVVKEAGTIVVVAVLRFKMIKIGRRIFIISDRIRFGSETAGRKVCIVSVPRLIFIQDMLPHAHQTPLAQLLIAGWTSAVPVLLMKVGKGSASP